MGEANHHEQSGSGNLAILTKVDKLRELIGNRIALPQLVVVGDQSSGKSSVLENLTGFAFPRAAELCTRYATQITCRREDVESITVSIMPNPDAPQDQQNRVKEFHREFTGLDPETLAHVFQGANEALGIRAGAGSVETESASSLPAFSEHILRIEKCGPQEEHFTVIDVPGIFRTETQGLIIETDIALVMNMVKNYMKDPRTIILAIMPSNVDPATQEILKLAKQADPAMSRTMAVLTKPDLAIERSTQQIAIDHVLEDPITPARPSKTAKWTSADFSRVPFG
ncbi:P-loop containing nucleoside triphosphate hydrolase protein [Xylariaceae sp. FL1019]|nr:P-loop containing nucleoside triphosphate hydrolase protein [Xylariaceae sp. FL1019]